MKWHHFIFNVNFSECIHKGVNEFAIQSGYTISNSALHKKLPVNHKNKKYSRIKFYLLLLVITFFISAFITG
jgi:hypothetical protein